MTHRLALAAAVLAAWAAGAAQGAAPDPATLRSFTNRAAELELALKRTRDLKERNQLAAELELVRHQMGPFDSDGKRVHPQAMWHEAAIEALAADQKRLGRLAALPTGGLPLEAEVQVRRMAAACLSQGWRIFDGRVKYQVNVYGQYLANNLRTLDAAADRLGAAIQREAKLAADSPDRAPYKPLFDKARGAVARMGRAAEALEKPAIPDAEDEAVKPLGEFTAALRAFHEAVLELQALDPTAKVKGPDPAPVAAEPEPPPMTEAEKRALASVLAASAKLSGQEWLPVQRALEHYVQAVENGFAVASARPKAREFLRELERAAFLAEGLHESKAVYPEYLKQRLERLASALEIMENPLQRAHGYARLADLWNDDRVRRQLELGGFTAAGARGVLFAYHVVIPPMGQSADPAVLAVAADLRQACRAILRVCDRLADWPPPDMTGRLPEFYKRQEGVFRDAVSRAGGLFPDDAAAGTPALVAAGRRANDLELLVRADRALKDVQKYVPSRVKPMYVQLAPAAQDLAAGNQIEEARRRLERLIRPFEGLEAFPMPEARHARAAARVGGRAYPGARTVFGREAALGIDAAASKGDPGPLNQALEARWLFGLLLDRAVADTAGLEKVGVANLASFGLPDKAWEAFVEALDQNLRTWLARYATSGRGDGSWLRAPEPWDLVYRPVLAAQRRTLDSRTAGESDLEFLLRNLAQASVAWPTWPQWQSWAAGYHVAEAATASNAGADAAADWHRERLRAVGGHLRRVELEPGEAGRTGRGP